MKIIALGANLPTSDRMPQATLEAALDLLAAEGVRTAARSRWWVTPAFPAGSGPDYVNGTALVETGLSPEALLAALHRVEAALGRARPARWAPRACDLDLVAWEDRILPDRATLAGWIALAPEEQARRTPQALLLPHPRMQDRGFVLAPLAEIAPGWRHPLLGLTVAEMLAGLPPAALEGLRPLDAG